MSRLVLDIGGTHLRMACAEGGAYGDVRMQRTPQDPLAAVRLIQEFVSEQGLSLEDAVAGVAGIVRDGVVIDAPNLPGWNGFAFADALSTALSVPVQLCNDAEIAGLAEALQGAGKGFSRVGYLTVGTGVGGVLVENGEALPHADGAEPGRQIIEYGTGRTLEGLVGGAALASEFGRPASELPPSVYEARTPALATGIYNAISHWSPDIVVLNGPLILGKVGFKVEALVQQVAMMAPERSLPPLVTARFRDQSGLKGAALL